MVFAPVPKNSWYPTLMVNYIFLPNIVTIGYANSAFWSSAELTVVPARLGSFDIFTSCVYLHRVAVLVQTSSTAAVINGN